MRFLRQWQIVLLLIGIFLVGTVSGVVLTVRVVKQKAAQAKQKAAQALQPQNLVATAARHYQEELELTPEQVEQLRPAWQQTARDITRARRDMFQSMQRMQEEMEQVLTPGQLEKFQGMREEARARIRKQFDTAMPPRQAPAPASQK